MEVGLPQHVALYLLGSFELARIQAGDQADVTPHRALPVKLPTRKIESLLAYLALHSGPHPREKLAALFWGDVPDEQARVSLRYALAMLRKQIGGDLLLTDRETVQRNPNFPLWVDAIEFRIHGSEFRIEAYRGDLLADFYDEWIFPEREQFKQWYLDALLQETQKYRVAGEYARAIEMAQRVLETDPANERAHQHMMFCYIALGNRHAALLQYEYCAAALREHLAVEPSPETTALYEWMKQARSESVSPASRLSNLPIPLTSFIGREREMSQVKRLLTNNPGPKEQDYPDLYHSFIDVRLLTLTGAGGSGKTRLAIQVGIDLIDAYRDGVWWVELAAITDGAQVAQVVGKVLGVHESAQQPLVETLIHSLRAKQLLLVIDNCEHLLDACAQLSEKLLQHCARLKILATSREALRIGGEKVYLVPTLSIPHSDDLTLLDSLLEYESTRLFVERVQFAHHGLTVRDGDARSVAHICRRLDGIPLAIELAAARAGAMSIPDIAAQLDNRFRLLTQGMRTALPRQQTLHAMIDWGHALLSDKERVLFRRLGVFVGGFTPGDATNICGGDGIEPSEVGDLSQRLVNRSLLNVVRAGTTRYSMLETIREFAAGQLAAAGEFIEFHTRHSDFFLGFAERADAGIKSADRLSWTQQYAFEHENIQAALGWAIEYDREMSLELPSALFRFWLFSGYFAIGRAWMDRLLASPQAARTKLKARALITGGELGAWISDPRGIEMLERALVLCRDLGDKKGAALGLQWLGLNYAYRGEFERAALHSAESVGIFRELGDLWQLGEALCWQGRALLYARQYDAARTQLQEGARHLAQSGDQWDTAFPLHDLARIAYFKGEYAAARDLAIQSLNLFEQAGDTSGTLHVENTMGQILRAEGNYAEAGEYYRKSLRRVSAEQQELVAQLRRNLGFVALHSGDGKQAEAEFGAGLEIARMSASSSAVAWCLVGFAGLAVSRQEMERAVKLLAAAAAIFASDGSETEPADRAEYDALYACTSAKMDAPLFDAAWEIGTALNWKQIV